MYLIITWTDKNGMEWRETDVIPSGWPAPFKWVFWREHGKLAREVVAA